MDSAASTSKNAGASTQSTPDDSGSVQLNTAPASGGKAPTPTGDQRKTLLYLLKAIDPGMSTNDDNLVSKSMELCGHMLAGDPTAKLDSETQKLFTNGSYTPQDYQIQAIQLALTAEFCR